MTEIYQERLETLGNDNQNQQRALTEAARIATDETRFTPEQVRINLTELNKICDEEGLDSFVVDILSEMTFTEGE
jgi:hypothetical protein